MFALRGDFKSTHIEASSNRHLTSTKFGRTSWEYAERQNKWNHCTLSKLLERLEIVHDWGRDVASRIGWTKRRFWESMKRVDRRKKGGVRCKHWIKCRFDLPIMDAAVVAQKVGHDHLLGLQLKAGRIGLHRLPGVIRLVFRNWAFNIGRGEAGELLHQGHEVAGIRVNDFGGMGVDDDGLPLLLRWFGGGGVQGVGRQGLVYEMGGFANLEGSQPRALHMVSRWR